MSQVSSASYSGTPSEEERFSEVSLREQAHHALKSLQLHMQFNKHKCGKDSVNGNVLTELLQRPEIKNFLVSLSQVSMFDSEDIFNALPSDLAAAGVLRSLRYCFARTPVDLAMDLAELADCNSFGFIRTEARELVNYVKRLPQKVARAPLRAFIEKDRVLRLIYERSLHRLAHSCPHAIYPTSAYRESRGKIWRDQEASHIETQMDLCYRAKIRVVSGLLENSNELANYYVGFGRVVCVLDKKLEPLYLKQIENYFERNAIQFNLLSYRVWEKDKHIGTVEKILETGLIRHGIAEIIKMAVMTDITLFKLLEDAGQRLVTSKFGTLCPEDKEFGEICDRIIGLALADYVKAEYENLWETHQLRPHAYGHTWSPGFELPAGLLHGHAIGVGMGLSTHMAYDQGFVTANERDRILRLFDTMEISFYNPIIHKTELLWACQKKMVEKRGGNLCAPVPRKIGRDGYIQHMPRDRLERLVKEYKVICAPYPRNGVGVEPKLTDVGMEEFES